MQLNYITSLMSGPHKQFQISHQFQFHISYQFQISPHTKYIKPHKQFQISHRFQFHISYQFHISPHTKYISNPPPTNSSPPTHPSTMSLKLYGFSKDVNAPSFSGFCQKLETFLRATEFTAYTMHDATPRSAPKGKIPYIQFTHADGATDTLADTHMIVRYLIETEVVRDPDAALSAAQRADSRAWQAWTEELVYLLIVTERWSKPANFAATKTALRVSAWFRPFFAWYVRRAIFSVMWTNGVGRHTDEERSRLAREYFEGLDAKLEGRDYFHGSEPTAIDTVLYGFLSNIVSGPGNPETTAFVLGSERLRRYTMRLTRKWFPEYEDLIEVLEGKN